MRARPLLKACVAALCCLSGYVRVVAEDAVAKPDLPPEKVTDAAMLSYASSLYSDGQITDARNIIESLLAEDPDNQNAQMLLATIMIDQREYTEAKKLFSELIEAHPENYVLLNNYAWMLATSEDRNFRDPEEALALAQEAILLVPNNYSIWSTLAQAHYVNGDFDKAVKVMRQCVDIAVKSEGSEEVINKYKRQLMTLREAATVMRLIE